MVNNDVWFARVTGGVAEAYDSWSVAIEAPAADTALSGGADDLYDVHGSEADGVSTVAFKRALATDDPWDIQIEEGTLPVVR